MYVWYRIAGGWDLGIHEYPFLNSLGTVLGDRSGMGGKMIRWTEYRMYTRSAVLTGVPKSTERPMVVLDCSLGCNMYLTNGGDAVKELTSNFEASLQPKY